MLLDEKWSSDGARQNAGAKVGAVSLIVEDHRLH